MTIYQRLPMKDNPSWGENLTQGQCDQIKIAKCLWKLPKFDFPTKMNGFDTFTKIA